jgi:hypothetical protein
MLPSNNIKMPFSGWQSGSSVEHLFSKCKALSSNPSTTKKKKDERKMPFS